MRGAPHRDRTARPAAGPLSGLTVLEIAEAIAGPVCGLQLADLGACVFKLEPAEGDRAREWGPPMAGDTAAIFAHLNRGKKSVRLDLASDSGRAVLRRALAAADVAIVHMDPLDRAECGLDWERLASEFRRLVLCEIDDMGTEGPYAGRPGSELILQALGGFTNLVGEPGGAPGRVGYELASIGAGMHAYQAAVAALLSRNRSGAGQHVRISALGALLSLISIMFAARSDPDAWSGFHLNGPLWHADIGWETKDGQITFDFRHGQREGWAELCRRVGLERLLDDPDYEDWRSTIYIGDRKDALGGAYRQVFATRTCEEISSLINELGGISVKFNDYAEFLAHPQIRHLDPLDTVPDAAEGARVQVGTPFRLVGVEMSREHAPAPILDADRGRFLAWLEGHVGDVEHAEARG